jgi:5-formyltetrahydrofolate cyclo-ligase
MDPKRSAREQVRRALRKLHPDWIRESSVAIQAKVLALERFAAAKTVSCFLSMPREVQTDRIVEACWSAGKRLCVPAFRDIHHAYEMCLLAKGDPVRENMKGIPEPVAKVWIPESEIDAMVIPALAFDPFGRRLGRGGGYYDRILASFTGLKVCVAFECQRLAVVPHTEHDMLVDVVVTETAVYAIEGRG